MPVAAQILPNRIMLIAEPVAGAKTAAIGFWFRAGSRHETAGCRGAAHFVEHMLFKGTASRSAFDIAVAFDRIGGYANAFTERENMCVHCVVPAEHTATALDVICDMTQNSVFHPAELERERAVIESEIISSLDDPEEAALDAASEAVWPGHPVSASIAGSVEDVRRLDRAALLGWYSARVADGPLVVCAAGCIEPEAVAAVLGRLPPRGEADSRADSAPPAWRPGVVFTRAPFNQSQFFVQFPVPVPRDERRSHALSILNAIVGDTMSSRLFQTLRETGGFCYNVYSFVTVYSDAACWCAYASASRRNAVRVAETLFRELRLLSERGFSDDELAAACEHLCGEEIIACEEMEFRMKRLFRSHAAGFPQRSPEEAVSCIRSVRRSEVERAMRGLLDFERAGLLVYGAMPVASVRARITSVHAAAASG